MPSSPERENDASPFDSLLADDSEQTRSTLREATSGAGASTRRATNRPTQPKRRKLSVVGVAGEVLMSLGLVMLLFVGWKYWLNDIIVGNQQNLASQQLSEELAAAAANQPPRTEVDGVPIGVAPTLTNERFAILYVPRWGADYMRPIASGTGYYETLNENIGHYEDSQMPGEVGNFAIAGHRLAYGASMQKIHELRVGDEIIVETAEGWYTYIFRSGEYVAPTQVDVLDAVPRATTELGSDKIMTLTSCNPYWSTAERIISYAIFDSFTPREAGPPESIQPTLDLYS